MTSHPRLWPYVLLVSAAAIGLASLTHVSAPLWARTALGLWFVLLCPGMALVRPFRLADALNEWMLAVAVSVSVTTIVSSAFLYAGAWSWPHILLVLMGICVAGALTDLVATILMSRPSAEMV